MNPRVQPFSAIAEFHAPAGNDVEGRDGPGGYRVPEAELVHGGLAAGSIPDVVTANLPHRNNRSMDYLLLD